MRRRLDLWPDDIENQRVSAPVTLLREQAYLLGNKTKNLVQGEVLDEEDQRDKFTFRFFLVAPAIGNYHYKLLTVRHEISLYPVEIIVEENILNEIWETTNRVRDEYDNTYHYAETEEQFIEVLRAIFNSAKARQVLIALLSQSDPDWIGPTDSVSVKDEDIPF